ncbi:MAG: hypothetical protein JSS66_10445 [Armatimonadetes bacterium]|nr:hypothetical protein [Armatimonadota bacterium]
MATLGTWVNEQWRIYTDNAPMRREYRSQLRSSRAPWLLTAYLSILVLTGAAFYWGLQSQGMRSAADIQGQLRTYYSVIIGMLEFLVALIAPVVATVGIVSEYQTKMIDLVFSSPMSSKYFLVGKLVSSYRYILILLAVSLPVASVSVMLGGASWGDVLSSYLLISFHGLVYMALSIPIAVMTGKPIASVFWSWLAVFGYTNVISLTSVLPMARSGFSMVPPLAGLGPYVNVGVIGARTEVFGLSMPLWVPTAFVSFFLSKFFLLGAGSAMSSAGSKETFSLRIHGLLLAFLIPALVTGAGSGGASIPFGSSNPAQLVWPFTLLFTIFVPYLSSWSLTGGSKYWPNGVWSFKWMLRGTPASGLPYLICLIVTACLGALLGQGAAMKLDAEGLLKVAGVAVAWAFIWSLGWAASAILWNTGPEAARRFHLLFMFLVGPAVLFLLGMMELATVSTGSVKPGWTGSVNWITFPYDTPEVAIAKITVLGILAVMIGVWSESRRRAIVYDYGGAR